MLYYGVKNNTSGTITSGTSSTVTIDMEGYRAIVIVPADATIGSELVLKSDMKDGYYQWRYNINDGGYKFTLLPDGRWKIFSNNRYGGAGSKIAAIIGIKSSTKITEVSTMSINSDQPISAGNLKAALDGLTGGSLLKAKLLIEAPSNAGRNFSGTLSDSIENYDFIAFFNICQRTSKGGHDNTFFAFHRGKKDIKYTNTGVEVTVTNGTQLTFKGSGSSSDYYFVAAIGFKL
ncbi:hypothetical protein [Collinsella tanakaei]|uniref:hypothetical protein n=1 Tax=Collinsella tanakaei TaxID=626935 RepID=UPI00059000DD|nr:hypothetical protein [Collinsella tanakaei]